MQVSCKERGRTYYYDKSITIYNPGKLYGGITIADLKTDNYQSHARNKLIAECFYLTNDIEKYGSGYIRVRKEISKYPNMRFEYRDLGNGFLVELSYDRQKITDKVPDNLTENQQKILMLVSDNPKISMSEMSKKVGISKRKILDNINKLRSVDIIKRVGSAKTGHWEAKE